MLYTITGYALFIAGCIGLCRAEYVRITRGL